MNLNWGECPRRVIGPLKLMQLPDRRTRRLARQRHVLADQDELGRDDTGDAQQKILRRAVVNRDDDDAAEETRPERGDPFRTVFAPENSPLARAEAEFVKPRGEVPRAL